MSAAIPVLGDTLLDAETIRRRIVELARDIDGHYRDVDRPVVLVCVLKGSLIFTADLVRALEVPVEVDCVELRSYGAATSSSGKVRMVKDLSVDIAGRHVLIVEDIVDTGHTIAFLHAHLASRARSVRLVTLLDKVSRRARNVQVDWRGFAIADHFVVGYGLDHAERFRNLPDVHLLDPG